LKCEWKDLTEFFVCATAIVSECNAQMCGGNLKSSQIYWQFLKIIIWKKNVLCC